MLTECVSVLPDNSFGVFTFSDNTGAIWGGGSMHATLFKTENSYALATFGGYNYPGGYQFTKTLYAGNWQPIEWKNHPMALGVEYRTTERWNGRAVYTMCVSCGALPNSSMEYIENILPYNITAISATGFGKTNTVSVMIPNAEISVDVNNEWGYIVIRTTTDMSGYTESYITVKYIKN